MFANTFQSGFISIFYSVGSSPLSLWDKQVKNGHIRRVIDDEVKSLVLEVSGTNVATTYITCPIKPRASLAIRLPFLVMIVKNMKKYFTFEIQILDDKDMHRRFRVSNFQCTTKVRPFCTTMPIGLSSGWNQIQFNLADFTRRAYGTMYLETMRVQVHANVRIRRIYFADRLYNEDEMPSEYRLFVPLSSQKDTKTQEQAKKEALPAARKESKAIEPTIEPSGAPPSPVATEAQGEQQRESEGDMSPEAGDAKPADVEEKTETSDMPQSAESPSGEEPQSVEPPSEEPISEEPPTDVIPSDEPPTVEPSTVEPSTVELPTEEPTVEAAPPAEGEPPTEEPQTEPDTSEPPTE